MRSYLVSTWQDIRALPLKLIRDREALAVIALTLLPWLILIIRRPDPSNLQQLGAVIGFIAFYWLIYHRQPLKSEAVRKPVLELAAALVLAALWILYRIGNIGIGTGLLSSN